MFTPTRWLLELFPIDEVLARDLPDRPRSHRVREGAGRIAHLPGRGHREGRRGDLRRHRSRRDRGAARTSIGFPTTRRCASPTGWITATVGGARAVDRSASSTDPERVWDIFQSKTLPRIYDYVMSVGDGKPRARGRAAFRRTDRRRQPQRARLRALGIDQERISPLEALHEDVYFGTLHFFDVLGKMGRGAAARLPRPRRPDHAAAADGPGRAGPRSRSRGSRRPRPMGVGDRTPGRTAGSSDVKLDIPKAAVERPSAVAALVRDGADGLDRLDLRDEGRHREGRARRAGPRGRGPNASTSRSSRRSRSRGTIAALGRLRAAGLYRDGARVSRTCGELRVLAHWTPEPAPAIAGHGGAGRQRRRRRRSRTSPRMPPAAAAGRPGRWCQWTTAARPGGRPWRCSRGWRAFKEATVYKAGESYMGREIWAMDLTSPVSLLALVAGQGHDAEADGAVYRAPARQRGVLHHARAAARRTAADRRDLAEGARQGQRRHPPDHQPRRRADDRTICRASRPSYMLHAGYLGSLGVDVTAAQWETDAIYPESKVRAQLWRTWLPDLYLNPHGYPSHEWVQLFSEYAGWVRNRVTESRDWWGMRGWFMPGFAYIDDPKYPRHKDAAMKIRAAITAAINGVPDGQGAQRPRVRPLPALRVRLRPGELQARFHRRRADLQRAQGRQAEPAGHRSDGPPAEHHDLERHHRGARRAGQRRLDAAGRRPPGWRGTRPW